jgi:GT2 family glycosyltransferase
MSQSDVTIAVVPRERFNMAVPSLESVYRHTAEPFDLVYVDGNSPRSVQRELERLSTAHGFELVRSDRYLSPNQARNLALEQVDTEYVCFIDNDLIVTDGWLEALLDCARQTGAWLVGPLYYEGDPADRIIHMAGGDIELSGEPGRRRFATDHRFQGRAVAGLDRPLEREPVDFVEFHCVLARTDVFQELGRLDEQLWSTREHLDLCLDVAEAGGSVWFEPASEVTYSTPPPVAIRDIPYFWLRWSEAWNQRSLEHFTAKHGIDPTYQKRAEVMRGRRHVVFDPVRRAVRRTLGERADQAATKVLFRAELEVNRRLVRVPAAPGA